MLSIRLRPSGALGWRSVSSGVHAAPAARTGDSRTTVGPRLRGVPGRLMRGWDLLRRAVVRRDAATPEPTWIDRPLALQLLAAGEAGIVEWNRLRRAGIDVRALTEVDLSGLDLAGADLSGLFLHGACLTGADLCAADLSGTDLTEANLRGARLRGADFSGADLARADLRDAALGGAEFEGAALHETRLPGWLG